MANLSTTTSPLDQYDPDPIRAGILLAARTGIAVKVYRRDPSMRWLAATNNTCEQQPGCDRHAEADICWTDQYGDAEYHPTCLNQACLQLAAEWGELNGSDVHLQIGHPLAPWSWERQPGGAA